jgi:hypothetical protein
MASFAHTDSATSTREGWGAAREICSRILAVDARQLDQKLDELLSVKAAA